MSYAVSRRSVLRLATFSLAAAGAGRAGALTDADAPLRLNLNENAFGPSPQVQPALQRALPELARYADAALAGRFVEQVAAMEGVAPEQVLPGEILGALGLLLSQRGGPGGEFVYSTPGYLALIDAAATAGGIGVPVPLNAAFQNDLPALQRHIGPKTRATYLINPHNPTGTLSDRAGFEAFLRAASAHAPVIVDEAYLEYSADFEARSARSLVRQGANVLVFRTFDKIYGLAGLPIGYTLGPRQLLDDLRKQGLGDAEGLGRLNLVAASAALADQAHVRQVRETVATERERWRRVLDDLGLRHTISAANFVFFDTGRPYPAMAARLRSDGVLIGRAFPPYETWIRTTIGTPEQNARAQRALRTALSA